MALETLSIQNGGDGSPGMLHTGGKFEPYMEIPSRPPPHRWGMAPPQSAGSKEAKAGLGDRLMAIHFYIIDHRYLKQSNDA